MDTDLKSERIEALAKALEALDNGQHLPESAQVAKALAKLCCSDDD